MYTLVNAYSRSYDISHLLLALFILIAYCVCVIYVCSYDISYYPNFNMFINFIFDNYDGHANFIRYIKSVHDLKLEPGVNDNTTTGKETFVVSKTTDGIIDNSTLEAISTRIQSYTEYWYNSILRMMYTKGNKVKFYRNI